MLTDLNKDLFGWAGYSWIFLPFGLWALRRNRAAWLAYGGFCLSRDLLCFLLGQRHPLWPTLLLRGIYGLTLASAAGMLWLAGSLKSLGWHRLRVFLVGAVMAGLIGYNLVAYLPARFGQIYGLYDVHRTQLSPFLTPQAHA